MRAWHFVGETLRDGSPVPKDGVWLKHRGDLEICESGLHWSREPFDALQYAPGPTLCLVDVRGEIIEQTDKGCSTERRIVARMDATEMLRYFSRMQALSVIHLWDAPDVVCDYLMTGEESIRNAARDAASAAAWDAASAAARAAWAAARDAASAAAWDAASAAARAAWAAARAAARDAAWDAAGAAAGAAALAAGGAAWAAVRKDFNNLTKECFWRFL